MPFPVIDQCIRLRYFSAKLSSDPLPDGVPTMTAISSSPSKNLQVRGALRLCLNTCTSASISMRGSFRRSRVFSRGKLEAVDRACKRSVGYIDQALGSRDPPTHPAERGYLQLWRYRPSRAEIGSQRDVDSGCSGCCSARFRHYS